MADYEMYKIKLEKQHKKSMKDIIFDLYVKEEKGPSMGAHQLGIPRQVFIHFVHYYQLKDFKYKTNKQ